MKEDRLRGLIDRPAPDEQAAEERGWRVVRTAFAERRAPARSSRARRASIAVAAALAVTAAALTPAGADVADWIADAVDPGRKDARPALVSLPAPGRLLVTSPQGPWIVEQDGSRRLLGAYDDASWSPGGLYAIATRGRELVAVDPRGRPRWSLARPAPVSRARWSPDGFRIAYLAGRELRVVAGDGTGDATAASGVAIAAPAWRPGTRHELAFVDRTGRVRVIDTDSRKLLWRSEAEPTLAQVAWSPDGQFLLSVAPTVLRLFDAGGRLVSGLAMPPGTLADSAAFRPTSDGFALVSHAIKRDRSRLTLVRLGRGATVERRVLFSGGGRFGDLAWSPDGEWLLAAWPSANQWVFIRAGERRRGGIEKLLAVANIAQQFGPGSERPRFPGVSGWCCVR